GAYGAHDFFKDQPLEDLKFYSVFLEKSRWLAGRAQAKGKPFILGEFGCQQLLTEGKGWKLDTCAYFGTPKEPLVGIQMSGAIVASMNAGTAAAAAWSFCDLPENYAGGYSNKWGVFRWSGSGGGGGGGNDFSPRAHYFALGLLTRFFGGPATVFKADS